MVDRTQIVATLRLLAKTVTPGKWWMDSHGEALVAFTDAGMKTVLKPEHLRDNAHRDENTGGLSYWPNDSDASWIAAAQPMNIITLLEQLDECSAKAEINEGGKNAFNSIIKYIEDKQRNDTHTLWTEVSDRLNADGCNSYSSHVIEYLEALNGEIENLKAEVTDMNSRCRNERA